MYDENPVPGIIGGIIAIILIIGGSVWLFSSVDVQQTPKQNAIQESNAINSDISKAVPVPQLTTSSERANVSKRAQLFNDESKVSYIYLVSYGKVMAFYSVTGKVSSLRSYMTPVEKIVNGKGDNCNPSLNSMCFTVEAPDIDGTYGENADGIFFFTTEGAYVEWSGEYMVSDQPLKLSTQPELIREIK